MSGGREGGGEGTGGEGRGEISLRAALNGPGLAEGVDAVMASEPARPRLLLINHFPSAVVPSIPSIHPPFPSLYPSLPFYANEGRARSSSSAPFLKF